MMLSYVMASTNRIIHDPTDLTRENNVYKIDYIPSGATHEEEKANTRCFFSNSIFSSLQLQWLPVCSGFEDRRELLKT
jgi:hypothetical protein